MEKGLQCFSAAANLEHVEARHVRNAALEKNAICEITAKCAAKKDSGTEAEKKECTLEGDLTVGGKHLFQFYGGNCYFSEHRRQLMNYIHDSKVRV